MLAALVGNASVRTIDDVVMLMTAIDAALPDTDGLKWFNRLYLQVTHEVRRSVAGATLKLANAAFAACCLAT